MSDRQSTRTLQLRTILQQINGAGTVQSDGTAVFTFPLTSFRNGSENPFWKQMSKQGLDATGALTAEDRNIVWQTADPVLVKYDDLTFGGQVKLIYKGVGTPGFAIPFAIGEYTGHLGQVDNRALVALHHDIQSKDTVTLGGVFLGELKETIRMLKNPAAELRKGLTKYLDEVVRRAKRIPRNRYTRAELAKMLAGTWLEHTFGWKPFINDIKDLASVFAHNEDLFPRNHARGHGYDQWVSAINVSQGSFSNLRFHDEYREIRGVRVIYRCGLKGSATAPFGSFERLTELSGFRMNQFVPTVWNLIPLSWAVDYFTNIGDVLECTATTRSNVLWVCRTVIYEQTRLSLRELDKLATGQALAAAKNLVMYGSGYGYTLSTMKHVERSSTGLRFPTLEFKMPAIDSRKWLNLGALVTQALASSRSLR